MLTIHHLATSQSERIVWLCEELELDHALARYERDPVSMLAPAELKAVHPLGASPVITDGDLVLAESGAIVQYLLARHGGGRLELAADHPDHAQYLYWFHYANANLQSLMGRNMVLARLNLPPDQPVVRATRARLDRALEWVDERLGRCDHLSGPAFTAADIMSVFSLTTMRRFYPLDLSPYPHILAYLQRIGARPAYQRAMQRADPQLRPLLT